MSRRVAVLVAVFALVLGQVGSALAADPQRASAPVDKALTKALESGPARFVVEFGARPDLKAAARIKEHGKRAGFVVDRLKATAKASQAQAVALVRGLKGANAKSYWLGNSLFVTGDAKLVTKLAKLDGVTSIHLPKVYPLVKPVETAVAIEAAAGDPEWGVEKINADQVWADGITGSGIVVGSIDTGVDFTHPALVNNYRGNNHDGTFTHDYNWWDPSHSCPGEPCDNVFHGTHTMGTMVGGDGPGPFTPDTGVAPGATWMTAKGCEDFGCTSESLLSSGQFILAPTDMAGNNADPSKAPDVVNNSWGSDDPNDTFYLATVQAWRAAGIIPVFSAGNAGPSCGSNGTPGDFTEVISAGATDKNDLIADFSSRGPSPTGKLSPNISAPGVDVISSVPGGGYEAVSGTSMAAPHTTGTIALMMSAKPQLIDDFDGLLNALSVTAVDRPDDSCGTPDPGDNDPNFVYGEGRIDAKAAVDLVKSGGTLSGTVTDAGTASPIAGARVVANDGTREFATTADGSGDYSIFLAAGTYAVTATAFGYAPSIVPDVVIRTEETTDLDIALTALPRFHVTGHVLASEDRSPIEGASIVALGTPVPAAVTDATGAYDLVLPVGDYTLRASAGGCTEVATAPINLVDQDIVQDFSLFRKLDDFGHGCAPIPFDWVDAGNQSALFGDEFAGRLRLPFDVSFYGETYSQIFLSDNGYLNFLAPDQYNGFPIAIPSPNVPNAAIYPFWQDLAVDAQSSIDYATIGTAPNRAFVLEYSDMVVFGTSSRVSFEVKLWESGAIDMLYGANAANPGDGRNAGIGIENAAGSDALQFSFLDGLVGPNEAFRYELVPSGLVHGTVTDANDDGPIAGATVTATPGGRTTHTAADGTYSLRLRPGSYSVAIEATNYVTQTTPVTVADGSDQTVDAALKASIALVDPTSIEATVDFGATTDVDVTLTNGGSGPLTWEAKERDQGVVLPPLPTPDATIIRQKTWAPVAIPKSFPRLRIGDTGGGGGGGGSATLETIITDPAGDSLDSNDVTTVRGGSDGSSVASMAIDFSPSTPMGNVGGYVYFDTDQNPATGLPAEALFGQPGQDIGMEYFADLFEANSDGILPIWRADTFDLVAIVDAHVVDKTIAFDIPLEVFGGDDGFINTGMVVGQLGPSDWAPDTGHGTIQPFTDVPWLSESPASGGVDPGEEQVVTVHLGTETLTPGEYHGLVVFVTNAPKQTQVSIPVTLTVTLPESFGAASGTVTNAHTGDPLAGVAVSVETTFNGSPLTLAATTGGDGTYAVTGPEGTWPATYTLDGYVTGHENVTIAAGVTTPGADAALHRDQSHASVDVDSFVFVLTPGRTDHGTINLSNAGGHEPLTFSIGEVNLDGAGTAVAAATTHRTAPTGAAADARSTKGLSGGSALAAPPAIQADGDVVASWNAGMTLPWGVGYTGDVYLSDPIDLLTAQFDTGGTRLGDFPNPTNGEWGADMAYDAGRGLLWQVNVGGDNGIYGIDPADGSVQQVITGSPWSNTSQRGIAYDRAADVFYVGGWNEGIVYRVAGPSHTTPGETLSQCSPADPNISGLAWNSSFNLLWEATNSDTDSIFLIDPGTCETLRALGHPDGGGFGGAGIELDAVGNLWTVGQNSGNAYLIESGLPTFSDVPWLSVSPAEGTVEVDGTQALTVSIDSTGLASGVYHAIVVIQTNDPDHSNVQVPVTLVVPAYQQGINAGGGSYVDPAHGDLYGADRAFSSGGFGYVGSSSTRSTTADIAGTTRDPLYQDLRAGMTAYRFSVPNGTYKVDLSFAELQVAKAGGRVFSVGLEGDAVLSNFDIYALVGKNTALDRSFTVVVTDGVLDISFTAQRGDKPVVNAILVTEMPPGS
ncbi:MAG TPA: carboxypeptidase regulatory-like domain-containing protein [Candidatus Limnocylindrales bacterium]|nr:carboxypeptidase regulatory-like domain-containing protein [Candidatus Limnocylindrales bacterium]